MQPALSLVYNSHARNSTLGIGWDVAGLGAITRCGKTIAQDTTPSAIALAVADGYRVNGNRLRLTSGADGSTYQTGIANFSLITAHGSAGKGPASFSAQAKDGRTYY